MSQNKKEKLLWFIPDKIIFPPPHFESTLLCIENRKFNRMLKDPNLTKLKRIFSCFSRFGKIILILYRFRLQSIDILKCLT